MRKITENKIFKGTGIVRNIKDQLVPTLGTRMMTFELEQTNKTDRSVRHIAVQMEGLGFKGAISNGHRVEIEGNMVNGSVVPTLLTNKSVNDCVITPRTSHPLLNKFIIGIGIIAITSFIFIGFTAFFMISKFLG